MIIKYKLWLAFKCDTLDESSHQVSDSDMKIWYINDYFDWMVNVYHCIAVTECIYWNWCAEFSHRFDCDLRDCQRAKWKKVYLFSVCTHIKGWKDEEKCLISPPLKAILCENVALFVWKIRNYHYYGCWYKRKVIMISLEKAAQNRRGARRAMERMERRRNCKWCTLPRWISVIHVIPIHHIIKMKRFHKSGSKIVSHQRISFAPNSCHVCNNSLILKCEHSCACMRVCLPSNNMVSYTFDCNEKCIKFKRRLHIAFIWITKKITFHRHILDVEFFLTSLYLNKLRSNPFLSSYHCAILPCVCPLIWPCHDNAFMKRK